MTEIRMVEAVTLQEADAVPAANSAGVPLSQEERENIGTLRRAIAATPDPKNPERPMPDRTFAVQVLGVNERHVRRMLAGDRGIRPWVLEKCQAAIQAAERRARRAARKRNAELVGIAEDAGAGATTAQDARARYGDAS